MSIVYTELLGSRSMNRDKSTFNATRTFLAYDDAGETLLIDDAINHFGGVFFSDAHPNIQGIYANSFDIKASTDRADTWEITWNYAQPMQGDEAGGEDDPFADDYSNTSLNELEDDPSVISPPSGGGDDDIGDDGTGGDTQEDDRVFTGYNITTGVALVDAWKSGVSIPANGEQGGASGYLTTDGTEIHKGGKPLTLPVPTADIGITITFTGANYYFNNVQLVAGKRNASHFYGFNIGAVLFTGMSVQRQDIDKWDVTYNFAWDAWSHMRQVPNRDDEGEIKFEDDETLKVWLKQPFPDTTSFSFAP